MDTVASDDHPVTEDKRDDRTVESIKETNEVKKVGDVGEALKSKVESKKAVVDCKVVCKSLKEETDKYVTPNCVVDVHTILCKSSA